MNEKIKVDQELKEAILRINAANEEIKRLKEATDRAKAVNEEVLSLKNTLQDEQKRFKELEEEKSSTEASLRAVQKENDSYVSQLKNYAQDIAKFKLDIP